MQEHLLLTQAVVGKEEVQLAQNSVGTFATVPCLITEEVDLLRNGLAIYPKHTTLPWYEKVNGARLHGICREMDLPGIIKRVVSLYVL